jgi:hypothetical protein
LPPASGPSEAGHGLTGLHRTDHLIAAWQTGARHDAARRGVAENRERLEPLVLAGNRIGGDDQNRPVTARRDEVVGQPDAAHERRTAAERDPQQRRGLHVECSQETVRQ